MRTFRPAVSLPLSLVLLVFLPGEVRSQEVVEKLEARQEAGIRPRDSTKRILDAYDLKRQARQAPGEAIATLDQWRVDGTEPAEEIAVAIAEVALNGAPEQPDPVRAGLYLTAVAEVFSKALDQAAAKGASEFADGSLTERGLYVRALEGLVDALQDSQSEAFDGKSVTIAGPLAEYRLHWESRADGWEPTTYKYIGASSVKRKKKDVAGLRSGLGAPIVAVRRGDLPEEPVIEGRLFPIYEYYYALTAVLDLESADPGTPRPANLIFVDPRQIETFDLGGVEYPLAIDLGSLHFEQSVAPAAHGRGGDDGGHHDDAGADQHGFLLHRAVASMLLFGSDLCV